MAEKKEAAESGEGEKKSKKLLIIIIAVVLVLLLIIGGAVGYFMFMKDDPPPEEGEEVTQTVPVPKLENDTEVGPMIDIEEFIVNIISGESNHYVKASLTLELSDEMAKEEANSRMPQIRDSILLLVSNKTFDELQDLQGKKQLKAELLSKLNRIIHTGRIKAIYFTDFVVQ